MQREVLRHEITVADEVVLLNNNGSEVGVDRAQDEAQTVAALGSRGVIDHVLGDEIVKDGRIPRLLTSKQIFDDVLRGSLAHGNSIPRADSDNRRTRLNTDVLFPESDWVCRVLAGVLKFSSHRCHGPTDPVITNRAPRLTARATNLTARQKWRMEKRRTGRPACSMS